MDQGPFHEWTAVVKSFCTAKREKKLPSKLWNMHISFKRKPLFHQTQRLPHSMFPLPYSIGETGRTIGSRIKEHLRMKTQTVYIHLKLHSINTLEGSPITWEILHSNIQSLNERRIIEALEIRKHSNNIMNGCIGRSLCI